MKRILLMSREYGLGGTERRLIDLGDYYKSLGYNVFVYFGKNKQIGINQNKLRNSLPGRIWSLLILLYKFQPDIVHTFDLESGIYVRIVSRLYFKKFFLISGMGAEKVYDQRTRKILSRGWFLADTYICNNKKAKDSLLLYLEGKKKVYCVWNGLNPDRFRLSIPEEETLKSLFSAKIVIGYIGKFDNIKHGERMLELAQIMLNEKKNIPLHFLLIGDGPNREKMMKKIAQSPLNIKTAITVTGPVNNAGILAKHMKIGILCSESEGFPNVLIEYMGFGIPWVSTNVGDIKDILSYGETGFVIDTWDVNKCAESAFRLIENSSLYLKMSNTGKWLFNEKFLSKRMGDEYLNVYDGIGNEK